MKTLYLFLFALLAIALGICPAFADETLTLTTDASYPATYSAAPEQILSGTFVASVTTGVITTHSIEIPAQRFNGACFQLWTAAAVSGAISNASLTIEASPQDISGNEAPVFTVVRSNSADTAAWMPIPTVSNLGTYFIPDWFFKGARSIRFTFHKNNNSTAYGFAVMFKE